MQSKIKVAATALLLLLVGAALAIVCMRFAECPAADAALVEPQPVSTSHKLQNIYDGGFFAGNGTTFYTSGVSGTVVVPAGAYVTMITCTASNTGGTVQITPAGPSITDAQASPPITLNASQNFTLGKPVLTGNPNEMGVGTTIVFTNTTTYVVLMVAYGGP